MYKNKLFVSINILGLSVAIASAIVAYLNYDFNESYDIEHVNANEIYRINVEREFNGTTVVYGLSPRPVGDIVRQNVTGLQGLVTMLEGGGNIQIEEDIFGSAIHYVEPGFFDMFTFELLAGSIDLTDKSQVAISDQLAEKYFGSEDPIGKTITHMTAEGKHDYEVSAVFRQKPMNSSFGRLSLITAFENYYDTFTDQKKGDWSKWSLTFIQTDDESVKSAVLAELGTLLEPQNFARKDFQVTRYTLDPLPGMAKRSQNEEMGTMIVNTAMPAPAVLVPMIMAGMLLLLACFNFTNTSIAVAGRRLKEIGLRKVMGGLRGQLVAQFLTENLILCLISLIIGVVMAEFLVPVYSEMWPFLDIRIDYLENSGLFFFLFIILLSTGILAGSYPAFYVSRFEPTVILRRKEKFGGAGLFSRILLVFQFTVSLVAVIFAISFVQNAKYQQDFDLGYTSHGVLHVEFENEQDYKVFRDKLDQQTWYSAICGTKHQLNESFINDPVRWEEKLVETDILFVNEEYFSTMDISVIDGRNFRENSETDITESVIISESFANAMQWNREESLGKRLVWQDTVQLYIIGVVENLYTRTLWEKMEPVIFRMAPKEEYRLLTVRVDESATTEAFGKLEATWNNLFPNKVFTGEYFDIEQTNSGTINRNISNMFTFLGLVAVILAISGLYSLVSLNIIKRMKEVAVRKVLGATITHVAVKMNLPFIYMLTLSGIIGSALGWIAVNGLMDEIWAYHVSLGMGIFIASAMMLVFLACLTIGWKVFKAASANPATTLRSE